MPADVSPHHVPRGRPLLALAVFLLFVFIGGALLAPWLYHAVQALAPGTKLARAPFARVENRALLLMALVGVPFYVRASGIRRWADVGLDPRNIRWGRVGAGFALGFFSLAAVCAVAIAGGGRVLNLARTPGQLAAHFAGALATAAVVAVIEELLFRGAIFGGLRRAMPWAAALVASSAIYAIVHFMGRPANPPVIDWLSGLRVLPSMLAGMAQPGGLVPALLNLTLAGMVLGLAYHFTGDILTSIGIHAGWIFWLKFYSYLTKGVPGVDPVFWGTRKLVDGWLAFVALAVVLGIVLWMARRGRLRGAVAS
ncbi:MAG TPA: type II CAAX endopeptidase family protein [Longimicrobium sp.]|nr:type II CAAX endopeptidase family protein [Longimicrobium sp.]